MLRDGLDAGFSIADRTAMSPAQKFLMDRRDPAIPKPSTPAPDPKVPPGPSRLESLLRVVGPVADVAAEAPTRQSAPQDWTTLIERVQSAAKHTRAIEAQAQERELRFQQIFDQMQEDIAAANDRVRAAEAQVRDVQARAGAQIMATEERAKAAEERARSAEEWLGRVHEAVLSEFAGLPERDAP